MTDVRDLLDRVASEGEPTSPAALFDRALVASSRIRRRRRRKRGIASVAVVAVIAVAIVAITGGRDAPRRVRVEVVPSTAAAGPARYSVAGTVLQDATHGPELCFQVLASFPPQCSGTPIANWDWKQAPGNQHVGETTSGGYRIVATYDGRTLTLRQPPRQGVGTPKSPKLADVSTPCPTPAGGWNVVDPSKVALDDFLRFSSAMTAPADYSASWVDGGADPPHDVYNARYTGNLEQHRAELAKIWGGPICITQGHMTQKEMRAILTELLGPTGKQLGMQVVDTFPDDRAETMTVTVMLATNEQQRAVDARYGPGRVRLESALTPVP